MPIAGSFPPQAVSNPGPSSLQTHYSNQTQNPPASGAHTRSGYSEALVALTRGAILGHSAAAKRLSELAQSCVEEAKEDKEPLKRLFEAARHHYVALEALVDFYEGSDVQHWRIDDFRTQFPRADLQSWLADLSFSDLKGRPSKDLRETLVSHYAIQTAFPGGSDALTAKIGKATEALSSSDESTVIGALNTLRELGIAARGSLPVLRALLVNDKASWSVRRFVTDALEYIAAKDDAETAMALASVSRPSDRDAPDRDFRYHATRVMLGMEAPVTIPTLITILENRGDYNRRGGASSWIPKASAERLALFGSAAQGAVPILMKIAARPTFWGADERIAAVRALEAIGDGSEQVVLALIPLLQPAKFEDLIAGYDQGQRQNGYRTPLRRSGHWMPTEGSGTASSAFGYTWFNFYEEEAGFRDELRVSATRALLRLGQNNEFANAAILRALDDYDSEVRRAAQGQE